MSIEQPTLDDYSTTNESRFDGAKYTGARQPREPETTKAAPVCDCGERVTKDFQRVMAGNDGHVYACTKCATATALLNGAAAMADHQERVSAKPPRGGDR